MSIKLNIIVDSEEYKLQRIIATSNDQDTLFMVKENADKTYTVLHENTQEIITVKKKEYIEDGIFTLLRTAGGIF